MQTKRSGNRSASRYKGGRPPTPLAERTPGKDGRIAVRIDPARQMIINATMEDQALAVRLMLHFPDVATVQDLPAYALHRLAAHTDD